MNASPGATTLPPPASAPSRWPTLTPSKPLLITDPASSSNPCVNVDTTSAPAADVSTSKSIDCATDDATEPSSGRDRIKRTAATTRPKTADAATSGAVTFDT